MNNRGEENEMSISVQNITKSFKDRRNAKERKLILKDISFDVSEGEFVSLLGPSGCGKTTTLTIIAGFQSPDEGKIVVNGKEVSKPGPDRAFMFQNYALFPWLKVGENIMYPMKKQKVPKEQRQQRLKELLDMAQLSEYENYYIHELSGGMRQRVCIAIGLACNPRLIIADEPTTALDVTIQAQILDLMRNLKDKINSSIMLITHDLGVIAEMADYVVVMYAGRVVEKGTASEIFKNPSHPYTIGLMRSKPVVGKKVDKLYSIPGKVPNPIDMPDYCYFRDRCELSCDKCQGSYPGVIKLSPTHEVSCYRYADRPEAGWLANVHPGEGGKTHE